MGSPAIANPDFSSKKDRKTPFSVFFALFLAVCDSRAEGFDAFAIAEHELRKNFRKYSEEIASVIRL